MLAASSVAQGGTPVPLALIGDAGFARRIGTGLSLDMGVSRSEYFA